MNKGEIRSATLAALNRKDPGLNPLVDTWIAGTNADLEISLRHRTMVERAVITAVAPIVTLPSDFISPLSLRLSSDGAPGTFRGPITYVPPDEMALYTERYTTTIADRPDRPFRFSVVGYDLEIAPWTGETVFTLDLRYYSSVSLVMVSPGLDPTEDTPTNFFMEKYPHIFLYKMCAFGWRHFLDEARSQSYEGLFASAISELNAMEMMNKIGEMPIVMPFTGRQIGSGSFRL